MTLFVEIIYVFACVVLILVVLLQAGRGGGLGTALGGGASQGVFGGGGGADFLAKLTQGLAATFMVCAVYLAYASAHTGSDRLKSESDKLNPDELLADADAPIDYERVGPNPLPLPEGDEPVPVVPEDDGEKVDPVETLEEALDDMGLNEDEDEDDAPAGPSDASTPDDAAGDADAAPAEEPADPDPSAEPAEDEPPADAAGDDNEPA
jgi:preprotein translocase subunit SecG